MATETLYATSHIAGNFANPNNALGAQNGTWAGTNNNNTTESSRWAMGDPAGTLTPGATQTIAVVARKGTNPGNPSVTVNLYENGTLIRELGSGTAITSTTGQTVSVTFNSSEITNRNNVEIEVIGVFVGGNPSTRNSPQVDSITWTADVAAAGQFTSTVSRTGTGTISLTPSLGGGGTHTVTLGNRRWYTDAADASMTALTAENAALAVDGTQVQNGIVRLRFQIQETGGAAGSGAVTIEYDGGSGAYTPIQPQTPGSNLEGVWFRWANGTATDGATLATTKLTGTTASGKYLESPGQSVSVGASAIVEVDAAVRIHWPPPDTAVTLRILYAGASIGTVTINTPTASARPHSVVRLDGDTSQKTSREVRFGPWQRVFYEPNEGAWWAFTVQYNTPTILRSYKRVGTGNWTAGATFTFSASGNQSLHAVTYKVISGTPTVYALFGNSSSTRYLARGTISGGTLTWGSEQSLAQNSDRHRYIDIDDGNYLWIAGTTASTGLWVRRSTSADSVSAFNAAVSISDNTVASGDVVTLVGLASDKVLVLWRPAGSNRAIKYAVVSAGVVTASGDATTTTTTGPEDWGVTRSGGYVYLIHSDAEGSGGNWVMRTFQESNNTWATATTPGVSGQPSSNDGIPLGAAGDSIYAFGTFSGVEGGQDRIIRYKKYTGPGPSGTWGSLTTLTPVEARVNSDHMSVSRNAAADRLMVLSAANDDDVAGNARTLEFFTLDTSAPPPGGTTQVQALSSEPSSGATSSTVTLGAPATAGNLLILTLGLDKRADNLTITSPSGTWNTILNWPSDSVSYLYAWRVAVGGEQTFTVTHTASTGGGQMWVAEYNDPSAGDWQNVGSATNPTDEVSTNASWSSGTATATQAGRAFAVFATDSHGTTTPTVTNGFTYTGAYNGFSSGSGRANLMVAFKDVTAGSVETTQTRSADQTTGAVAVFAKVSSGLTSTVSRTGTGAITATPQLGHRPTVSRTGTGTITASPQLGKSSTVGVVGTGSITATPQLGHTSSVSLVGTGTITATPGGAGATASVALAGTGTISATPELGLSSSAAVVGTGTISATPELGVTPSVSLAGTGTISATPELGLASSVSLAGTGTISATPLLGGSGGEDTSNFDAWVYYEDGTPGTALVDEGGFTANGSGATYDATITKHGAQTGRYPGSGTAFYSRDVTGVAHFRLRMYVRFENDAQTAHQFLVQLLNASDTYQADLQLRNTGGGTLYNRWGFSSYQDWMDSALARDTWRRIDYEFQFTGGGVSTDFTKAYIYDPADDTVLVDTLQAQSFNLVKTLQVGVPQAGGVDVNLDSLALTLDGSNPGPYTESSGPTAEGWFIKVGGVEVPMTSHVKVGGTEVAATSHIKVAGTEQPVP